MITLTRYQWTVLFAAWLGWGFESSTGPVQLRRAELRADPARARDRQPRGQAGDALLDGTSHLRAAAVAEAGRVALASLFNHPGRATEPPLALVDRFRARLGAAVCHGITGHDDVRPEHAWKPVQPDFKASPKGSPAPRHPNRTSPAAARPLWLLAKPIPVKVRQLTLLHGPERIESGWWNAAAPSTTCRRDYYVARHTNGTTCWVFSESEDRWFVHGCFA